MSTSRTSWATGAAALAAGAAAISAAAGAASSAVVAQAARAKVASREKGSKIRRIDILRVSKRRTIASRFSEAIRLPDSGREGPHSVPEAVVTGWILLSGKEGGGSDEDSS